VSYMYTNSIELVPRFGLLPSPRMGCDLEHFVVKWDQQYMEDEQACTGGVGIVLSKSDATVRKASAATRPSGSAATGRHSLSSC